MLTFVQITCLSLHCPPGFRSMEKFVCVSSTLYSLISKWSLNKICRALYDRFTGTGCTCVSAALLALLLFVGVSATK